MKYSLVLCIFSVFFVNYVHGDCPEDCTSKFTQDMATLTTPAQACVLAETYLACLETTCKLDVTPYLPAFQETMTRTGVTCHLTIPGTSSP
ncbi:uncharacterized protein LOC112575124 isoform X2 [Pomacea canaliculata]|uniref:uncharacterized protein LOC112575124 isoform X2 n=1 Tax=Pomacea canaliculata TaxID=400727 RepID=UPI000D7257B4|nr:uncharacterized protein LOC112575124 isoform X2 [Pomacea canaliculata]